jgi:phosphatidylglycerol:prolipoprotein diacylglycerol transferase
MPLAVIPWFQLPSLTLGPFTIQSFGILSALGILAAVLLAARGADELGRNGQVIHDFAVAGVLTGVVVGHLVHVFLYHPEELRDPWRVVKFWEGLSSMGGLAGGVLAAAVFFRVKRIRFHDYADAFALGTAPGWGIARVGCFTVHDHPGRLTDFFLGVRFPAGVPGVPPGVRHDLGLYEAILLLALGAALWILHRKDVLRGRLLGLLALVYGAARFLLDFLRAEDIGYADRRYLGLTPAQYVALALLGYAAWALGRSLDRGAVPGRAVAAPRRR